MKDLVKIMVNWAGVGIGYMAGIWLWDNVLEDKVEDLKDRLSKKSESEGAWGPLPFYFFLLVDAIFNAKNT